MADIRINALTTTATSSASDDYIAIDGSANGTRKLSVYSPTFGGNLTVSGSGGATINYSTALSLLTMGDAAVGSYSRLVMRTGPSKTAWAIGAQDIVDNALTFTASTAAGGTTFTTPLMTLTGGGNLLIGTTTDSGNGKLQLATHTTSAGGIGFGTDTSLFRSAAGNLQISASVTSAALAINNVGSGVTALAYDATGALVYSTGSLRFQSNGTTALTLDSSQRTILSGPLRLANAYAAGAPAATGYVTIQDSSGTTYKVLVST